MVCQIEVTLLTSPKGHYELECQGKHQKAQSLTADSSPLHLQLGSLSHPLTVSLRSGNTCISSQEIDLKSSLQKHSECTKSLIFMHNGKRLSVRIQFKLREDYCVSCVQLEKTLQQVREELEQSPQKQDEKLTLMLEKSHEARQELQQLLRESADQMSEEVRKLNQRILKLIEEQDSYQRQLNDERHMSGMLQLELEETKAYNKRMTAEIDDLTSRLEEASSYLLQDPIVIKETTSDLVDSLQEDKFFLNNEVLRLKEEVLNLSSEKDTVSQELIQIKNNYTELKKIMGKENSCLTSEVETLKKKVECLSIENRKIDDVCQEALENYKEVQTKMKKNDEKYKKAAQDVLAMEHKLVDVMAEKELIQKELDAVKDPDRIDSKTYQEQLATLRQELEHSINSTNEKSKLYNEQLENFKVLNRNLTDTVDELQQELAAKRTEIHSLSQEKEQAYRDLAKVEQYLCVTEDMNQILDDLKLQNANYKNANEKLVDEVSSMSDIITLQSTRNQAANNQIEKLNNELAKKEEELALARAKDELKYEPIHDDPIDSALAEYLNMKDSALEIPFVREDFGIYKYGGKRVFVKVEKGEIIVRSGGSLYYIDDFVDSCTDVKSGHVKQSMSVKYQDSTANNDITPKRAAQIVRDQLSQGKFSAMYAKRASNPMTHPGINRTNSLKKISDY